MATPWLNLNASAPTIDDPASSTPSESPGALWNAYGKPRRPDLTPGSVDRREMTGAQIANARRADNYQARKARMTNEADKLQTAQAQMSAVNANRQLVNNKPVGAVDPSRLSRHTLESRLDTEDMMSQNDATRAAHTAKVAASYAKVPHNPYALSPERAARIAAARRRVAMDPASQAGTGSQFDPYRRRTTGERMMSVARSLKPGDAVSVTEGNEMTLATMHSDGIPTTDIYRRQRPAAPQPGMVSEDGGKTWQPVRQATAALEQENERRAAPARVAGVENQAYADAIKSGEAKTYDQAAAIATRTASGYKRELDPYYRRGVGPT